MTGVPSRGGGPASCFSVLGSGFSVQGSGFRVQGSRFRVSGFGFRVSDLGFRVPDRKRQAKHVPVLVLLLIAAGHVRVAHLRDQDACFEKIWQQNFLHNWVILVTKHLCGKVCYRDWCTPRNHILAPGATQFKRVLQQTQSGRQPA